MRPHRRRGPLEHVLVAGSESELSAIEALLLLLPSTAYGQVLVESEPQQAALVLTAPPRVTVTCLKRSPADEPGVLLAGAVHAWLAEWMPEEPDPARMITVWVGRSARDRVNPIGTTVESF
ncbi:MAG TPA: SIP domain-containing protein [Microlunatus sp.]|jgi:NADPH-dependent ferric siderophore reductase|nr:SIP domain-containing protein [Microlunatus sp.]